MGTNGTLPIGNWYPQPFGQYPLDQAFRQAFDDIYALRDRIQTMDTGGTGFWNQQGNLLSPTTVSSTVLIGSASDDNSGALLQVAGDIHSTGLLWGNIVNTDTTYDIQKVQTFRKSMASLQWSSDGKTWNNFTTVASPWTLSGSDVFPNSTSYKVLVGINTEDGSSAQLQVGGGANINTSIYMIGGVSSFRRSGGNLQWSPDGSSWNTFATTANPWTLTGTSLYPTSTSDIVLVGMTTTDQSLSAGSLTTLGSISAISATTNASVFSMGISAGNFVSLRSAVTGTGTLLPMAFSVNTEAMRILTTRNVLINQTSDDGSGTAFTGNKWLELHGSLSMTGNSGGGYQARIWMDTDTSLGQSAGAPGVAGPGTDNTAIDNQGFEGNFFRVKSRLDYFDWTNWNVTLASGPLAAHTLQLRDSSGSYLMNYSGTGVTPPGTKGPSTGVFTFIGEVTTDITGTNGFQAPIFRCNNGSDYFDWLTIGLGTHAFDIRDSGSNAIVQYRNPSVSPFTGSFAIRGLVFLGSTTDDGSGAQLQVRGINGNINASGLIQSYTTGTNLGLQVNSGTFQVLGNGLCGAANFNLASSGTYQIGGVGVFRINSGTLQWSQDGSTWNNFSTGGAGGWTESAGLLFPTNLSDKVLVNRNSDDGTAAAFQVNGAGSFADNNYIRLGNAFLSSGNPGQFVNLSNAAWFDGTSWHTTTSTGSVVQLSTQNIFFYIQTAPATFSPVMSVVSTSRVVFGSQTEDGTTALVQCRGLLSVSGGNGLLINQNNDGSGYLLQCNGGIEMTAADATHNILSKGTAINAFAAPNGGILLGLSTTDVTGSIVAGSAISSVTASLNASICGIGSAGGRSTLFSSRSGSGAFQHLCFDTSLAERMRILWTNGNVLIGTTTDNGPLLQVAGAFATYVGGVSKFGVDTAGNVATAGNMNIAAAAFYQIGSSSVFRLTGGILQWSQNNGATWNNFGAAASGVTSATGGSGIVVFPSTGAITISNAGVLSLQGTTNQVLVNGTGGSSLTGALTLTTPQNIDTFANVTFNTINVRSSYSAGGNLGTGFATGAPVEFVTTTAGSRPVRGGLICQT